MRLLPLLIPCLLQNLMFLPRAFSDEPWRRGDLNLEPSCKNEIYCESEFLHDVQMATVYEDSKHFVDMKLKYPGPEIISKYAALKRSTNGKVPRLEALKQFINENLESGRDLDNWTIPDYVPTPSILDKIKDPKYKEWAIGLNDLWVKLARKVRDDVKDNADMYSVIWVPNGFVVPGGRFQEMYYWDTYWIVNGLLLCDMNATARGVIDNMVTMVDRYGYVPNGGRVYYLNRSQPPMLILMVYSYVQTTGDIDYLYKVLPSLETEFQFWMTNRTITFDKEGHTYTMVRYYAPSRGPRPESYREDFKVAQNFKTAKEQDNFYTNIKSAAETGWDFSGRWYINENGSNTGGLSDIQTPNIVPVDLNSIIQMNARIMCSWFEQIGDLDKAGKYCKIAKQYLINIREVMWRPEIGSWFDWDLKNHKHRDYFYASNIVPLWTESYDTPKPLVAKLVLKYLRSQRVIDTKYNLIFKGIPTSLVNTAQQWDYPNAWPSLQALIIQGLKKTKQSIACNVAIKLADVWLRFNYKLFLKEFFMYEKYEVQDGEQDGEQEHKIAKGGEYITQTGFGWTNGVVLELLNQYGETVKYTETFRSDLMTEQSGQDYS